MQSPTRYITDAIYLEHDGGPGHPEQPARLQAIERQLKSLCLWELLEHAPARDATEDEIARCHERAYIAGVKRASEQAARGPLLRVPLNSDTACSEHSWVAALRAAGAVLSACEAVVGGRSPNAFCAVRPPGHHARPAAAMGFCLFGNVAIAARHCQQALGCEKIAIVDWDVHHGNGTQEIFYEDPTVLFVSTHQYPHYPGSGARSETGEGPGAGTTVNLPFAAGAGADEILPALREVLCGRAREFDPDLVLISAGFDSCAGDPLGEFKLEPEDFRQLTLLVRELADACCGGRIVSVLEGGYDLTRLGPCVEAHIEGLRQA